MDPCTFRQPRAWLRVPLFDHRLKAEGPPDFEVHLGASNSGTLGFQLACSGEKARRLRVMSTCQVRTTRLLDFRPKGWSPNMGFPCVFLEFPGTRRWNPAATWDPSKRPRPSLSQALDQLPAPPRPPSTSPLRRTRASETEPAGARVCLPPQRQGEFTPEVFGATMVNKVGGSFFRGYPSLDGLSRNQKETVACLVVSLF